MIFETADTQSDSSEMFGRHHASRNAVNRSFHSTRYCFTFQFICRQQELNRPLTDDDVFVLNSAAFRFQMLIDGRKAYERSG